MSKNKRMRCSCGLSITPWQQRFHERSKWHKNFELIMRMVDAKMTASQIAGAIGASVAYVSMRLKEIR